MNKTWLIIKREYLTRVRKKTFILSTILTPLLFVGIFAAVTYITVQNMDSEKVAVIDPNNYFDGNLENGKTITFDFVSGVVCQGMGRNKAWRASISAMVKPESHRNHRGTSFSASSGDGFCS